jgi:hypothetical protein
MIKTLRGAAHLTGVSRVITHRRVMVSLALSGFSLHDAHVPPINGSLPTLRCSYFRSPIALTPSQKRPRVP